jgi:fructose-1,6-bisphosphatase/inositol monophosphatase family enzyme
MRVLQSGRWDVRMFATTLVLAYVASGRLAAAVYASDGPSVHLAAGLLLAQEAGATVTDEGGDDWDLDSSVYVAAATPEMNRELQVIAEAVVAQLRGKAGDSQ